MIESMQNSVTERQSPPSSPLKLLMLIKLWQSLSTNFQTSPLFSLVTRRVTDAEKLEKKGVVWQLTQLSRARGRQSEAKAIVFLHFHYLSVRCDVSASFGAAQYSSSSSSSMFAEAEAFSIKSATYSCASAV